MISVFIFNNYFSIFLHNTWNKQTVVFFLITETFLCFKRCYVHFCFSVVRISNKWYTLETSRKIFRYLSKKKNGTANTIHLTLYNVTTSYSEEISTKYISFSIDSKKEYFLANIVQKARNKKIFTHSSSIRRKSFFVLASNTWLDEEWKLK